MEAAFNPSIALPFPYTTCTTTTTSTSYGGGFANNNVASFAPSFPPHPTTTFIPPLPTVTTTTWMDTRIWRCLPEPLLDRILAFLPLPAFFRARSVCKRWYALLYSNSFLELYLQVSPTHNWFIFFTHKTPNTTTSIIYRNNNNNNIDNELGDCCTVSSSSTSSSLSSSSSSSTTTTRAYVFDPYELKWYTIPTFPVIIPLGFSPVTSSGGLVCWASDQPGLKSLFLHNPVVGSVAQLPPTRRPRLFPSVGLCVTKSSVDVILAGDDMISPYAVKNLTSETFHIDSNGFYTLWDPTSTLPRLCSLESGRMVAWLSSSSETGPRPPLARFFYCMNYSPYSVLAYEVQGNMWWKIQAPMRRFLRSPCLVEIMMGKNKKKVVMVAGVEKSKLNVPRSLRMWVLQGCGTQWVEIERMPQQLYAQFEQLEGGRGFDCVGSGEFIVIMINNNNNNNNNNSKKQGLVFNMESKSWGWMPECPCNSNNGEELHGFAYEPTLVAPVTSLLHQLDRCSSSSLF